MPFIKKILFLLSVLFLSNLIQAQNEGELINQVDSNNLKQGFWKITAEMREDYSYDGGSTIEEGGYKNSRKTGLWTRYYPNGSKQSEITYVNGRPKGSYKTYYDNGKIEEDGSWSKQRNTGDFKRYYRNGNKMQDFSFTDSGVREGEQLYYYENGNVEVKVDMVEGKENGVMKRYRENGDLKYEVQVKDGKADQSTLKEYVVKNKEIPTKVKITGGKKAKIETAVKPNLGTVNTEGYNKLYTRGLLLKWDGYYHLGKPWNGKKYIYNNNGILQTIEIYKDGMYIGNGVIEKE